LLDVFLYTFTMYRVFLYGLLCITCSTLLFGVLGILPYSVVTLSASLFLVVVTCYAVNEIFSCFLHAVVNTESWIITALILYLIMSPVHDGKSALILIFAGAISMASKYIITPKKNHIFNPAAFGAFMLGIFHHGAVWWVGSSVLTPVVV